jgi:phenylacetic acid degradation protein
VYYACLFPVFLVPEFMPVYSLEGLTPVIHPDAFVHETAVLIGDVIIGAACYIGPYASLRGDFGRIIVDTGANVQDTCVMHSFPGKDCIVASNGHIGHGAVLHGCRVGVNAMVGMNAVVMDNAVIGENSVVGAMAFVAAGFECPAGSLVIGAPAKIKRELTEEEISWKSRGTREYQQLAERCRLSLKKATALAYPESNRPRIEVPEYDFKP